MSGLEVPVSGLRLSLHLSGEVWWHECYLTAMNPAFVDSGKSSPTIPSGQLGDLAQGQGQVLRNQS